MKKIIVLSCSVLSYLALSCLAFKQLSQTINKQTWLSLQESVVIQS